MVPGRVAPRPSPRINHDYVHADLDAIVWPRAQQGELSQGRECRRDPAARRCHHAARARAGAFARARSRSAPISRRRRASRPPTTSRRRARGSEEFGGGTGYDMSRDLGVERVARLRAIHLWQGELELAARALGSARWGRPSWPTRRAASATRTAPSVKRRPPAGADFALGGGLNPARGGGAEPGLHADRGRGARTPGGFSNGIGSWREPARMWIATSTAG